MGALPFVQARARGVSASIRVTAFRLAPAANSGFCHVDVVSVRCPVKSGHAVALGNVDVDFLLQKCADCVVITLHRQLSDA